MHHIAAQCWHLVVHQAQIVPDATVQQPLPAALHLRSAGVHCACSLQVCQEYLTAHAHERLLRVVATAQQ